MSSTLQAAIIRGIVAERHRADLTQQQLADRLGWSRQTVNMIEQGRRSVLMHEQVDLCKALGVTLAQLLVAANPSDKAILGL